jgi:hypothetical protein
MTLKDGSKVQLREKPSSNRFIQWVQGFWGADDGNVTGARRFHAFVGAVLVVQLVFATLLAQAPRWEGTLGQTRLSPIAKALREPPLSEAG